MQTVNITISAFSGASYIIAALWWIAARAKLGKMCSWYGWFWFIVGVFTMAAK